MYYIYKHIDTNISLDELSSDFGISKYHMLRVFKAEFNQTIYDTIQSIRLQKASSLLLTNRHSTITDIASMCGYSSQSAFIRVFKNRFLMTPKEWRNGGYKKYAKDILSKSIYHTNSTKKYNNLTPKIVKMPSHTIYYIRNRGYNKSIKETWQKIQTWILTNGIKDYQYLGLHHDNPSITPLSECRYLASIIVDKEIQNSTLPTLTIPSGVYAEFNFSGEYGEILSFIHWVYLEWLVDSGYETSTNPSYAIYHKNHFLEDDGKFEVSYYIPIRY
jgi:AraC family transcriptional regulator